jgi:hypothetical protein
MEKNWEDQKIKNQWVNKPIPWNFKKLDPNLEKEVTDPTRHLHFPKDLDFSEDPKSLRCLHFSVSPLQYNQS